MPSANQPTVFNFRRSLLAADSATPLTTGEPLVVAVPRALPYKSIYAAIWHAGVESMDLDVSIQLRDSGNVVADLRSYFSNDIVGSTWSTNWVNGQVGVGTFPGWPAFTVAQSDIFQSSSTPAYSATPDNGADLPVSADCIRIVDRYYNGQGGAAAQYFRFDIVMAPLRWKGQIDQLNLTVNKFDYTYTSSGNQPVIGFYLGCRSSDERL
jgi:hypothetical protein